VRQATKPTPSTTKLFQRFLTQYKTAIDQDIDEYSRHVRASALNHYGLYAELTTNTFLQILNRGGKRIRGVLVCMGYQMAGGNDQRVILQAARAIEMLHAYILIIDDIQDRSSSRRGGPSAHTLLADYHQNNNLKGDPFHFGVALALNAALGGAHAAQMTLANIPATEENRLKVLSIVNRTMLVTAHGQTLDIMNEFLHNTDANDIDSVLEWKTAHYSFLNPIHVGMVLAGADCEATDAITPYALGIGRAYQITDDIIGTFGSMEQSGKSPMDDMKEGKRTLLSAYALKHAQPLDKSFLNQQLGNATLTHADFERCKSILKQTGALKNAQARAKREAREAVEALNKESWRWDESSVAFLRGLAQFVNERVQ
jgi:geranylgeranyl diphosphate synthase type I